MANFDERKYVSCPKCGVNPTWINRTESYIIAEPDEEYPEYEAMEARIRYMCSACKTYIELPVNVRNLPSVIE